MDIRVLQLQKKASIEYKYIQDRYSIDASNSIIALADGTTQSFKSEVWADLITEKFTQNPSLTKKNLSNLLKSAAKEQQKISFQFNSNPAKASLEKAKKQKGSTATFLGVQITSKHSFKSIFCGDTNLFQIHKDKKITAFPFSDVDTLDQNNKFINTEDLLRDEFDDNSLTEKEFQWEPNDKIVLATDALSRLILKDPGVLTHILGITSFEEFLIFCNTNWNNKLLEEDDISVIIITNNNGGTLTKFIPSPDFSFPPEKSPGFIPTPLTSNTDSNNLSAMHLSQIMNQFHGVANDFNKIKQKLKLHQLLLIATIILLVFNIAFTYIFRKSNSEKNVASTDTELSEMTQKVDNLTFELNNLKLENRALKNKKNNPVGVVKESKAEISQEQIAVKQPNTKEEIVAFQKKNGLDPDGNWGPNSKKMWEKQTKQ